MRLKKTLEELRDLLLDDYKEQLKKQNIESDDVKRIADFCLKLQKMDSQLPTNKLAGL